MLDAAAHMLLLQQQAKIKAERPADASFLPLSLALACLLRQPPAGLAPPAGGLSLQALDRLPQAALERALAAQLLDEPLRAFAFVCALVRYAKLARALLSICQGHLQKRATTAQAAQQLVQAVVAALPPQEPPAPEPPKVDEKRVTPTEPPAAAADPAGIMRRAVGRDVGDGSAVLETMKKYAGDTRIQAHGVRALKGVIRGNGVEDKQVDDFPTAIVTEDDDTRRQERRKADADSRRVVQTVIDKMKQFPESLPLQRDGLLSLAEYASQADEHVGVITSSGGVISIIDAMVALPDDASANMAGLSVLAHPKIADESVVRVNPESRRLVLSAMERFPLNEQLQGLGCLALANLSLRQDASMVEIVSKGGLELVVESMKRFSSTALVQAAGCWLIAIISDKNEEMKTACLDAGALSVCEKARIRFSDDPKVQQHAVQAIQTMLPGEVIEAEDSSPPETCALQ